MKKNSHRAKIMLLGLCAVLLLMPIGRSDATLSEAALGPKPVLAQAQPGPRFGDNTVADVGSCSGGSQTYNFQANADDVVVIRMIECADYRSCCCNFGTGCCYDFTPCIELRDQGKNLIATNCGASIARVGPLRLTSDSTYSITVHGTNAGAGRYNLFLQRTNSPGRAEPLSPGDNLLIFLNTCGETHTYTFKARAGDRVKINMVKAELGNIDPVLELYDNRGRVIEAAGKGSIDRVLTSGGSYTLLAFSVGSLTGTYRISLEIIPTQLNIPFVSTGQASEGIRQTTFALANAPDAPARGMLEFFGPDGVTPMEVTIRGIRDFQFPVSIPAGGVQILETQGTQPLAQGIAKVTTDVGIKANVIIKSETSQTRQTVFELTYGLPTPTKTLTVPVDSVGANTDTGLVLFNPPPFPGEQPQTAMITLRLVNRQGQQVGEPVVLSANAGQLAVGAKGEFIRYMSELFPMAPGIDEFQGTIRITSTSDVSVLAVQKRGDRLTVVPGF